MHALGLVAGSQGRFGLNLGDLEQHQRGLQWADDGFALFWAAGLNVTQDTALTGWICVADDLQALFVPMVESSGARPYRIVAAGVTAATPRGFRCYWACASAVSAASTNERPSVLPVLPQLLANLTAVFQTARASPTSLMSLAALQLAATTGAVQLSLQVFWLQGDGTFARMLMAPFLPWLQALLKRLTKRAPSDASTETRCR